MPALSAPADSPPVVTKAELVKREEEWQEGRVKPKRYFAIRIAQSEGLVESMQEELAAGQGDAKRTGNRIGAELEQQAEFRRQLQELQAELINGAPYFNLSRAGHAVANGVGGSR